MISSDGACRQRQGRGTSPGDWFAGPGMQALAEKLSYSGAAACLVMAFGWICVGMACILVRSLADFSVRPYGHTSFGVAIAICGLSSSLLCLFSHGVGSRDGQGAWSPDLRLLNRCFSGLELRGELALKEAELLSAALAAMPRLAARRTVIWGAAVIATTTIGEAMVSGTTANSWTVLFSGSVSIAMLVGYSYLVTELYSADGRARLKQLCFDHQRPVQDAVTISLPVKFLLFAAFLLVSQIALGGVTLHGSREWPVLVSCVVFSFVSGGMLMGLTALSILRSFREIIVAADDLAAGGAGQIFSSSLDREMVELAGFLNQNAKEINATREHLEEMVDDQTEELRLAVKEAMDASLAKGRFLATMSHEIRTPMNAILGMAGLLLDSEQEEDQREFTESIQTSGETLLGLLNEVLDFSKLEVGKMDLERVEFDVRDIIDGVVDMLAERAQSKGLDLVSFVSDEVHPFVWGDPKRLLQVLVNIVGNAIKFTGEGEVVIYATRESQDPELISISVRDTGIGIPKESTEYIFHAFSQVDGTMTRSYGGTGLGLAISKELVELMSGEITLTSEVNVGSEFKVTLPVEQASGEVEKRWEEPGLLGCRVMLVEDNQSTSDALTYYLSSWGAVISQASSPEEAQQQTARQGGPLDLALVDAHMGGTTAAEWRAALSVDGRAPRVVMMFNRSDRLRDHQGREESTLRKPISRSSLARLASRLTESAGPRL